MAGQFDGSRIADEGDVKLEEVHNILSALKRPYLRIAVID